MNVVFLLGGQNSVVLTKKAGTAGDLSRQQMLGSAAIELVDLFLSWWLMFFSIECESGS